MGEADSAGGDETWKVARAASIEKQLRGAGADMQTVAACLGLVPSVVQPGHCKDAAFALQAAEGLLFEALAALLQQVSCMCQASQALLQAPQPLLHYSCSHR